MTKLILLTTTTIATMLFSGCANNTPDTSTLNNSVQTKTQEKVVEKTMDNYGIPTLKKEKTTEEKVADVATGKTTITDAATDMAADKLAKMALKQVK